MQAIVTGGAGFIGSNIVDALIAEDHDVVVIDDLSTGRLENLHVALAAGATLQQADVRDSTRIHEIFAATRPELVFHLAAQIDVRRSVSEPHVDADINVGGAINVLEAARATGVKRVVYSSTGGALYGDTLTVPSPEDTPIQPISPYGQSKFAAEGYFGLYQRLHGLSTITLRYANVYGPRQDPLGEGGVIAIFCGKLIEGSNPTIYGDGMQTRDYTHVADVVRANLLAADTDIVGAFNIGRGEETSVVALVDICKELSYTGDFDPHFEPARPGEVARSALDPSKARRDLGWHPQVDIAEGLRETLESLRPSTPARRELIMA
jgi:UDP-glucose 4-epimerase